MEEVEEVEAAEAVVEEEWRTGRRGTGTLLSAN